MTKIFIALAMFGPLICHWCALVFAARFLAEERCRLGDHRPVPSLFNPLTSHQWLRVLIEERTSAFRQPARRAFSVARISLCLFPVGCLVALALAENTSWTDNGRAYDGPPPVNIQIPEG